MNRTVDLISYTVVSLDPVLQLEEAAPGSGKACGSTFLNRIFAAFLNDKFEDDHEWNEDREIFTTAMEHFETKTKINFNGTQGDSIPVHGVTPQLGIKKGRLAVSKQELKKIFKPVMNEIIALIQDQIRETEKPSEDASIRSKKVKLVLLVGGFGNSFYLRNRISERFGASIDVKVAPNRHVLRRVFSVLDYSQNLQSDSGRKGSADEGLGRSGRGKNAVGTCQSRGSQGSQTLWD